MTKERTWPVRAMYILIAAALAIGLFITAVPAPKVSAATSTVKAEWAKVSTPSEENWVLAAESYVIDYAVGMTGGEIDYALMHKRDLDTQLVNFYLLKSTDGAATWEDITDALNETLPDNESIVELLRVACDDKDPKFVAVALSLNVTGVHVFISEDGGSTFQDTEETGLNIPDDGVFALAVSPKAGDGKRNIAIGGTDWNGNALLFRCTATGDSASAWKDATAYDGWYYSVAVTDIQFSPNWNADKIILVATVDGTSDDGWDEVLGDVYLQSGYLGTTEGWNAAAGFADAVPIVQKDVWIQLWANEWGATAAGITLPSDYNNPKGTDARVCWVWVNYWDDADSAYHGKIFRVENDSADPIGYQIKDGKLLLTNVSYWGTRDQGKVIVGVLGDGKDNWTDCCTGVQVYRYGGSITDMDVCCPRWEGACPGKLPSGRYAMWVSYVSADKAYAVAQGRAHAYDESAWSVSFDDGYIWNQLSLIDTWIDYLSDVAVSPDCNKTFLVSVHKVEINGQQGPYCGCDSVWVFAKDFPEAGYDEYSGHWLRTWYGELTSNDGNEFERDFAERGLLRLAPEETTGNTVYLIDRMTDTIYLNKLETLSCWSTVSTPPAEIDSIVDLAVKDKDTLYALDASGYVAMFADGDWQEAVKSKVDEGNTIAVHGDKILVGGHDGQVSYSDDGGETFALLEEDVTSIEGDVSVAFDSYFGTGNTTNTNKMVYAATAWGEDSGIYRWVIGESDTWEDMGAKDYDYTGIVLGFKDGNLKTSAKTGGVLYASYADGYRSDNSTCWSGEKWWYTGVARSLNPAKTIECQQCVEWDYLTVGLTEDERFLMAPQALKICGCTQPTTDTKLFAIGAVEEGYDMHEAEHGTVWTFDDCYAKKAPEITSPAGSTTIPADPCSCYNAPFSVTWDALCDACKYDVQFALDRDFTTVFKTIEAPPAGSTTPTSVLIEGGLEGLGLSCEMTYYLRVRAVEAGTCQEIHSFWSDAMEITIAPSVQAGIITLVAPVPGALNQPTKSVGFSWDLQADADSFRWVLSKNSDLSAPLDSKNVTSKACTYANTLDYATTYYWQVKAYNEGVLVGASSVGTFTTAATGAFCCPIDGLCFATEAQLIAHNATHPVPGTPFWVWVVIAIGAVLVIVVIVLIFRTRRV